jgi:hypothetical protein
VVRKLSRTIDEPDNPYKAIVSVMVLREGWDVQNVVAIVGLRPFTSSSKILPEQTLGRGRLPFLARNWKQHFPLALIPLRVALVPRLSRNRLLKCGQVVH